MNKSIERGLPAQAGQRGTALILALIFIVFVLGIVGAGTQILQSNRQRTAVAFARDSQALQIARSGLTEARSWLNRQVSQPVLEFVPVLDESASPPILDTIDPDIGIVREFRITGDTWARYEVWKRWDADPDPTRAAKRVRLQCEDISALRSASGAGAAWNLVCMGYVYHRADSSVAFDVQPNYLIASQMLETEVQRLILQIPGQAAINVGDGNRCHINTKGRVIGGPTAGGIYYPAGTGTPTTGPGGHRVTGSPALATTLTYDDSFEYVFGMPLSELKSMATMSLTDLSSFPVPVPDGALIVVDRPSMTFNSSTPLRGNGIVVLSGNVTLSPGNLSNFSGFLYIDGNFSMRAPSDIRGAVVCTGNMTLQGAADFATITYDDDTLAALRRSFGSYSISRGHRRPLAREQ